MQKTQKIFILWFLLVVIWNFAIPGAKPIYDVMVAVALSFVSYFLNHKL